MQEKPKKFHSKKIVNSENIGNTILSYQKMNDKKKINLSKVRNFVLILIMMICVGFFGFVYGKYQITGFGDFVNGVKAEFQSPQEASTQTIVKSVPKNKDVDMDIFWEVWEQIESKYLFPEDIDYQKMIYGATVGMSQAVGDPYTAFFPPQENKTSKENLSGSFEGVGIQLGYRLGDQLSVIAPISGMPAEKAGVRAGDFILKIVDEKKQIDTDTYGMSLIEALEIIRGEKGTPVKLTLLHEGDNETYEVEIIRDTIVVPSVEVSFGQVIDGNFTKEATGSGEIFAHLKLSKFGELTAEQWDKAIDEIVNKKDVAGVVLDVRNNPGGLVTEAVNLVSEFLERGQVVVQQDERGKETQIFKTSRYGRLTNVPLVVLINKGSASASEILAGALREHNRAKLVGETTFGKGTMQSAFDIPDGSGAGLHITIARWLTPNANWIHEKGIDPDEMIELDKDQPTVDTQMVKACELIESGEWKVE